jgi:splicing factor U2AF subunit
LTDVVPILERKRRLTQWDIKPPGYENVTSEQAKLSGMFPLPGAPRQQPMDPTRLQAFMNQPANAGATTALKPSNARQSKRLFVHGIPSNSTEDSVVEFFNLQMNGINIVKGMDPCLSAQISPEQDFALLEFKTPEDATTALALDGLSMTDAPAANGNGRPSGLRIRRPKDYIIPAITDESEQTAGIVSENVPDTQNKVRMTNIPTFIEDAQVKELLTTFGELKSFVLAKDTSSGASRGFAFFEYMDPSKTDEAVAGLNGIELGDGALNAARAAVGMQQVSGDMSVNAMSMLAGTTSADTEQGRVLCLLNMVTGEELMDNDEYEGKFQPIDLSNHTCH